MFCPNCGTKNIENALFCCNCGIKLENFAPTPAPAVEPEITPEVEATDNTAETAATTTPSAESEIPMESEVTSVPEVTVEPEETDTTEHTTEPEETTELQNAIQEETAEAAEPEPVTTTAADSFYNSPQTDSFYQTPQQPQKELGMKWFHFVIYFQLFVSALVGLWNGFQLLTGRIYGENTDRVYSYFSGLKGVDTIIGICYIAIAIFALVTRFMLADFKKCGPAMYIGMQVAGLIISIAYIASVTSIVDGLTEYIASSTYGTMAVSIVMLICNIVYFKKRKHLFDR